MVTLFVRGLIRGRLRTRAVPVFGPSDVGREWVWSDSGSWPCAVWRVRRIRRVRRFVLVLPSPLVLRSEGIGYESRRFERCARLGTALLPLVPTYSRGSGDIGVIQIVDSSKV